jgi:hypothetical protein
LPLAPPAIPLSLNGASRRPVDRLEAALNRRRQPPFEPLRAVNLPQPKTVNRQ